jgi:hypothetical protein
VTLGLSGYDSIAEYVRMVSHRDKSSLSGQIHNAIDALGMVLPERTFTVRRLSLVIQTGSELARDWTVIGTADPAAPHAHTDSG